MMTTTAFLMGTEDTIMQSLESLIGNMRSASTPAERLKNFIEGLNREAASVLNSDMNQTKIGLDRLLTLDDKEAAELAAAIDQHTNGEHKAPKKVSEAHAPVKHGRSAQHRR